MLKIPSAENWRKIVARSKYPLLFIYELKYGLLEQHKAVGLKVKMTNYCRVRGGSYLDEKQAQAFIKELRKVLQRNPQKTLFWIKDFYHQTQKLFSWLEIVNKKVSQEKLSKAELKKIYQQYEKKVLVIWRWGYLAFLMADAIEMELNRLLTKTGLKPKEITEALKILTISPKITLHRKEEIELLRLAIKVKKFGLKKYQQQIRNHLNKWGWKYSWIYFQHPLTKKELEKETLCLVKKNPRKILTDSQRDKKREVEQKKKFLVRFKNKRLRILADILGEYALWHSIKMEEMTKVVYLAKPLFDKLAKKFDLTYIQFTELVPEEVAQEKIDLKVIKARIKDNGVLMIKGKWQPLSSRQIKQVKNQIERRPTDLKKLTGFTVFKGRVIGRVVIASEGVNVSKLKVKSGDVLVAAMTVNSMVPLVKKAAAIVTDEGGILCHAAIIARELRKPCVIGTKFATKIFKTGDKVEVDANKGIVKKIK